MQKIYCIHCLRQLTTIMFDVSNFANGVYIIEDVSNKYLDRIIDDLKEFDPEVIILNSSLNIRTDNNLICFRKY